jgi:hypothetical protein
MKIPEKIIRLKNNQQVNHQKIDIDNVFNFDNSTIQDNLSDKKSSLSYSYSNSEISDIKISRKRRLKKKINEDEIIKFIDTSSISQYSTDKLKLVNLNSKPITFKRPFQTNYLKRTNSLSSPSLYDNSSDVFLFRFNTDFGTLKNCLESILREIRIITNKLVEDEKYEDKQLKCKFAAVVLDRLCMVIFSILIFLSTAIIFTSENFMKNSDPDHKY